MGLLHQSTSSHKTSITSQRPAITAALLGGVINSETLWWGVFTFTSQRCLCGVVTTQRADLPLCKRQSKVTQVWILLFSEVTDQLETPRKHGCRCYCCRNFFLLAKILFWLLLLLLLLREKQQAWTPMVTWLPRAFASCHFFLTCSCLSTSDLLPWFASCLVCHSDPCARKQDTLQKHSPSGFLKATRRLKEVFWHFSSLFTTPSASHPATGQEEPTWEVSVSADRLNEQPVTGVTVVPMVAASLAAEARSHKKPLWVCALRAHTSHFQAQPTLPGSWMAGIHNSLPRILERLHEGVSKVYPYVALLPLSTLTHKHQHWLISPHGKHIILLLVYCCWDITRPSWRGHFSPMINQLACRLHFEQSPPVVDFAWNLHNQTCNSVSYCNEKSASWEGRCALFQPALYKEVLDLLKERVQEKKESSFITLSLCSENVSHSNESSFARGSSQFQVNWTCFGNVSMFHMVTSSFPVLFCIRWCPLLWTPVELGLPALIVSTCEVCVSGSCSAVWWNSVQA